MDILETKWKPDKLVNSKTCVCPICAIFRRELCALNDQTAAIKRLT